MKRNLINLAIGAALVIVVLLVALLCPASSSLAKLEAMYRRGEYDEVCAQLVEELQAKPDWHAARGLLISSAVKDGQLDLALTELTNMYERCLYSDVCSHLEFALVTQPHWQEGREFLVLTAVEAERLDLALTELAKLRAAGWDTLPLEDRLSQWLKKNKPPLSALTAAQTGIELNPAWEWLKEYYLNLLIGLDMAKEIPPALVSVVDSQNGQQFSHSMEQAVEAAWQAARAGNDINTMWQLSVHLDNYFASAYPSYSRDYRLGLLWEATEPHELAQLQAKYSQEPILAAELAQGMGWQDGLKFMRGWEESNDPKGDTYYCHVKLNLLLEALTIEREDLSYINPPQLLRIAEESLDKPEKCTGILDELQESGDYPEAVKALQSALVGPQPFITLSGGFPNLSPDGNQLVAYNHSIGLFLFNVEAQKKVVMNLDFNNADTWRWAPDSSRLAENNMGFKVYNTNGELVYQDHKHALLGWQDADHAWVTTLRTEEQPLLICHIVTGMKSDLPQRSFSSNYDFLAGPKGYLAWVENGSVFMQRGSEISQLAENDYFLQSWVPDGSGLLLKKAGEYFLWTGGEPDYLPIAGSFLGWRNPQELYWSQKLDNVRLEKLMGYDIKSGKSKDYNMVQSLWAAAAGNTGSAYTDDRIAIHRLP